MRGERSFAHADRPPKIATRSRAHCWRRSTRRGHYWALTATSRSCTSCRAGLAGIARNGASRCTAQAQTAVYLLVHRGRIRCGAVPGGQIAPQSAASRRSLGEHHRSLCWLERGSAGSGRRCASTTSAMGDRVSAGPGLPSSTPRDRLVGEVDETDVLLVAACTRPKWNSTLAGVAFEATVGTVIFFLRTRPGRGVIRSGRLPGHGPGPDVAAANPHPG